MFVAHCEEAVERNRLSRSDASCSFRLPIVLEPSCWV